MDSNLPIEYIVVMEAEKPFLKLENRYFTSC